MVDTSGKIDVIVHDYIEQGAYFTINRARQYGKTTTLFSKFLHRHHVYFCTGSGYTWKTKRNAKT
jgi:hypothetical protein